MSNFTVIAAVTQNFGLGYKNQLPWYRFPVDMKWFREQTGHQTVIMGRKTWESMKCQPLPGRHNFILSSRASQLEREHLEQQTKQQVTADKPQKTDTFVMFFNDLDQALEKVVTEKTFVIGGAQLYQEALTHPKCESLLITHLDATLPVDTCFPDITQDNYLVKEILQSGQAKITSHSCSVEQSSSLIKELPYSIVHYVRHDVNKLPDKTSYRGESGYLQALKDIIDRGEVRDDRTGVGTQALFGLQFRYDLSQGCYPLLTTKKMFTRGIFGELLWFLRGQTDNQLLIDQKIGIWTGNSTREFLDSRGLTDLTENDIGPSYGFQFRHAGAKYQNAKTNYFQDGPGEPGEGRFDQVEYVIDQLRNNPHGRRAIINLWNPSDLGQMALPPCLFMYQFWVSEDKYLCCSLYQRSGDMGLGVPFNIASASLLMNLIGRLTGLIPKELVHTIGDAHIYLNHREALRRQVTRRPRPFPRLRVEDRGQSRVEDFVIEDFKVEGYFPYPGIKMEMAV